jgi:Fur family ferric uptake transcriptional regulator
MMQERVLETLRQHGYRITPQRRVVVEAIARAGGHLSPSELYARVYRQDPSIGVATIYRTLQLLESLGLVCQIRTSDEQSYVLGPPIHHHHLVCSGCGMVVDFTTHGLDELEQRLALETGFAIRGHVLDFVGVCSQCQSSSTS